MNGLYRGREKKSSLCFSTSIFSYLNVLYKGILGGCMAGYLQNDFQISIMYYGL